MTLSHQTPGNPPPLTTTRPAPPIIEDPNPELVQPEDWKRPKSLSAKNTPLFLIHDGGGTTFAYHCLSPLFRTVYGIRNPRWYSGKPFEGGISEMGRLYANLIRDAVLAKDFPAKKRNANGGLDIMLGGWSLGGLLSLEVARELHDDGDIKVVGMVMIDSVYPTPNFGMTVTIPTKSIDQAKSRNHQLSQQAMTEATRMIQTWQAPRWTGWEEGTRPPAVLIRAKQKVPRPADEQGEKKGGLDGFRGDRMLGWGQYDGGMFEEVIEVDGHHFDLFEPHRVEETTRALKRAVLRLESKGSR